MNELCFIVDHRELFLDQVLVDYNEDPVLFVCTDNERYYLVLCVDIENKKYYISQVALHTLVKMISGESPMRNAFLDGDGFWSVLATDSPEKDVVSAIDKKEIGLGELPKSGAVFECYSPELKAYAMSLNRASIAILAQREKRSIVEISFEEGDGHFHEISCSALAEALASLQNLVYSLAYKEDRTFGQFPRSIRDQYELKVTDTFAASFGVQLKTKIYDDEVKQKESDAVIEKLNGLLAVSEEPDSLKKALSDESRRTCVYYNAFLNGLKRNNMGFSLSTASPFRKFDTRHMSTAQVNNMLQRIGRDIKEIKRVECFEGVLKGINIDKKRFTFITEVDNESIKIDGTISEEMIQKEFKVPWKTSVTVETTTSFDKITGKEKHAFKLVDVN